MYDVGKSAYAGIVLLATLPVILFLVVGLLILLFVDETRARLGRDEAAA